MSQEAREVPTSSLMPTLMGDVQLWTRLVVAALTWSLARWQTVFGHVLELIGWVCLVALVVQSIQAAYESRRDSAAFWGDLTITIIVWIVADGFFVWASNNGLETWGTLARLFGGLAWLATWLAAARQPHRVGHWRPRKVERRLDLIGAVVVGLGLGFYFVGVTVLGGQWDLAAHSTWLLLISFGVMVSTRFLAATLQVGVQRWRWIYGSMTAACVVVTAGHVESLLSVEQPLPAEVGGPWSVTALALIAISSRLDVLLAGEPSRGEMLSDPVEQGPLALEMPYWGLAASLPIAHYLAHRFDLLPQSLETLRETTMLVGCVALAAVSVFQQRRLAAWTEQMLDERRRIENKLLTSQRRLQLAEERRQAEEALFRAREKHAKAFRASSYAVSLTTLEEGRFLDCNDRFLEIFGFSRQQVIGHTVSELEIWADLEERAALVESLTRDGSVRGMPMRFRRGDGEIRSAILSAEHLEIGGVPSLLSVARDLGDEQSELSWHREVASLVADLPQAMWRLNLEDRVLDANLAAERLAASDLGSQLNGRISRQLWVVDPAAVRRAARETASQGSWRGLIKIHPSDDPGRTLEVRCWWSLVRGSQELPTGKILVVDVAS